MPSGRMGRASARAGTEVTVLSDYRCRCEDDGEAVARIAGPHERFARRV